MKRLLMAILPGAENWLMRRLACLASVGTFLHAIEVAVGRGDSATVGQLVIGLGATLGIYVGGTVADDHSKRVTGAVTGTGNTGEPTP